MTFLLSTWLQSLSHKLARGARAHRGAKRNRQHRVVLRLEALEDRMVPSQNGYIQTNLVSDLASENAQIIDPNLKNPWGIAESADGRLIGVAELSIRTDLPSRLGQRVGYVEGLFVVPEARGQGIARALLQASREWARQQGCTGFASDRAGRTVIDRTYDNR